MLTLTFWCAAMYSSARAFHRLRPGSLFWMWYQVISTAAGVADGAAVAVGAALSGGAVAGLGVGLLPLVQAPATIATMPRRVAARRWNRIK